MTIVTETIILKKIELLEEKINALGKPKGVLGKMHIDEHTLKEAKKGLFDFDIEKYVSKKDVAQWKKS
jgi:hypothetical protein